MLIYKFTLLYKTSIIQFCVIKTRLQIRPSRNSCWIRDTSLCFCSVIILLKCFIGTETHATKHASIQRILIHNNTVILIITCERSDRQNQIMTIANLTICDIIIIESATQGCFAITKNMNLIIKPILIIR